MTPSPFPEKAGKTILTLKVTPRGSANKIQTLEKDLFGDTIVKVMVTAVPDKGEANQAVIELLSKQLKVPKSAIQIVSGQTSRVKIVAIAAPTNELWTKLQEILDI